MAETVQVLKDARALIADPERHAVHASARDAQGEPCAPLDTDARSWCACGAIDAVDQSLAVLAAQRALGDAGARALASGVEGWCIREFNDTRTHAEVLAKFDQAIAAEEAKAHG